MSASGYDAMGRLDLRVVDHRSYTDRSDEQASERSMELIWVALRNAGVVNEEVCFSRGMSLLLISYASSR